MKGVLRSTAASTMQAVLGPKQRESAIFFNRSTVAAMS